MCMPSSSNKLSNDQRSFLQDLARTVYGSGAGKEVRGGDGYIGMLGGRIIDVKPGVKTWWGDENYKYQSSHALAAKLAEVAGKLSGNGKCPAELQAFLASGGKKLLERKVVAKALSDLGVWEDLGYDNPAEVFMSRAIAEAEASLPLKFNTFALSKARELLVRFGDRITQELISGTNSKDEDALRLKGLSGPKLLQACREIVREKVAGFSGERDVIEANEKMAKVDALMREHELSKKVAQKPENAPKDDGAKVSQELEYQKDDLKSRCFDTLFGELLKDGKSREQIEADCPIAMKTFEEEWTKQWGNWLKIADPKKPDVKKLMKFMTAACGDIATIDRFNALFKRAQDSMKASIKSQWNEDQAQYLHALAEHLLDWKGEEAVKIRNLYSEEEREAVRKSVEDILASFLEAKNASGLPPEIRGLKGKLGQVKDAEDFLDHVGYIALDSVSAYQRAAAKDLPARRVGFAEKANGESGVEGGIFEGRKQRGGNTCFIKSVINSMIGSAKGREVLTDFSDDEGNCTFKPYDPVLEKRTEPVVVTAEELEDARKNGVKVWESPFQKQLDAMDDVELAVWLALGKLHGQKIVERPGGMGEANLVANLFGFKAVTACAEGDLGAWADTVDTLNKGGLAIYRYAAVDEQEHESGYKHFVSITGVTCDEQTKAKGYEVVDSLGNETEAGLGLRYEKAGVRYSNQVLRFEYVEPIDANEVKN